MSFRGLGDAGHEPMDASKETPATDEASLLERLKSMKEWSRAVIFTDTGKPLASTFNADPSELE